MPGMWMVKDGAITPKQSTINNWVFWRGGQPADFELRLSFRYHSGNSGVQVRTIEFEPFQSRGYQVEVAPQAKMGLWHHSKAPEKYRSKLALAGEETIYAKDGTKSIKKVADPDKVKSAYKEDDWNDLVVIAKGPTAWSFPNSRIMMKSTPPPKDGSPFRITAREPKSSSRTFASGSINNKIVSLNSNT